MSYILNQYGLKFFVVKSLGYKTEFTAKSTTHPVIAEILTFSAHIDEVDDINDEVNNAILNNSYEDLTVLYNHIRILPNEIRIYQKGNDNYNTPNLIITPNDFRSILSEWKNFLQANS